MSRVHVRCCACEARRVFKKNPECFYTFSVARGEFINRAPKCGNCDGNKYRVDRWMNERDTRATACRCTGYVHMTRREWPHRTGSHYCWYRKDGSQRMPGDVDFKDFQLEQMGEAA